MNFLSKKLNMKLVSKYKNLVSFFNLALCLFTNLISEIMKILIFCILYLKKYPT